MQSMRGSRDYPKLPGIGEKTAARLAFHMLKGKKDDVFDLPTASASCAKKWGLCRSCFGFSEVDPQDEDGALCDICRNPEREADKICVVEEPADLIAVEKIPGISRPVSRAARHHFAAGRHGAGCFANQRVARTNARAARFKK